MRDKEERQAWSHCAAWRQAHRPCISSPGCQQDVQDKDSILLDSSPFYWVSFGTSLSIMAFQIGSCHGFWKIKAFQRIWCPMAMQSLGKKMPSAGLHSHTIPQGKSEKWLHWAPGTHPWLRSRLPMHTEDRSNLLLVHPKQHLLRDSFTSRGDEEPSGLSWKRGQWLQMV